jgi:cyclopropane fatty-acyl-phospholipid synthase-like methyltransferase
MHPLSSSSHLDEWFGTEARFCQLYPQHIRRLNDIHWTPLAVASKALRFLKTKPGDKILDIGSGVGKFCLAGAYYKPGAFLYGIEQRRSLIGHASRAQEHLGLTNVRFIQGDFTQVDFKEFNHFYFFNSFGENLTDVAKIDECIEYSTELYFYYSNFLRSKLETLPDGTRFVSYCSCDDEVPLSYTLVNTHFDGMLKFWLKQ